MGTVGGFSKSVGRGGGLVAESSLEDDQPRRETKARATERERKQSGKPRRKRKEARRRGRGRRETGRETGPRRRAEDEAKEKSRRAGFPNCAMYCSSLVSHIIVQSAATI